MRSRRQKRCFCSVVSISVGLQSGTLSAWGSFLQDAADGFRMYWPRPQISTVESRSKELLLRLGSSGAQLTLSTLLLPVQESAVRRASKCKDNCNATPANGQVSTFAFRFQPGLIGCGAKFPRRTLPWMWPWHLGATRRVAARSRSVPELHWAVLLPSHAKLLECSS